MREVWLPEFVEVPALENDKYVVFKKEQFDHWMRRVRAFKPDDHPDMLKDAIVIRRQDIFAGPGLHAYAAAISTVIEMMEGGVIFPMVMEQNLPQLYALREFFHAQALLADEYKDKKFPD